MKAEQEKAAKLLYRQAANGDVEALNFLLLFHDYAHRIDDFIDESKRDPEELLAILAYANILYSTPFYSRNAGRLHLVVAGLTNAFGDSLAWAGNTETWKSEWADKLRFAGNDMVLAIAMICGGFKHMRELSPMTKELSWMCHHGEDGQTQ